MNTFNEQGRVLALLAAGLLSACGGGGSGGGGMFVSGAAATGAAIAAGTVTMKCVSGTTSAATTGTDGSFRVDVGSATLPCLVRVSYLDGGGVSRTLHSIATTAGTANVTPVTELLVASLTGGSPATAFDSFDASRTRGYTSTQIAAAATAVRTYLNGTLGVNTSLLPTDPVGASLKPAVGAAAGDDFDHVLDDLAAKLVTAGKTLGDAVATVGAAGGGGGSAAGTLTVTAASNGTRNGVYAPTTSQGSSTGTDIDITGQTSDGNFELDVLYAANGTIKHAYVWYFTNSGATITFFGCNGGSIPCVSNQVSYDPLTRKINFSSAVFPELASPFPGPATSVSGGEVLTLSGAIDAI